MVHGGAAARPFHTHLNAFDLDMSLRIATELYLKRCIVGGIERVYEIGPAFRNEGVDSSHSPEYTLLEAYQAYGDYDTMAELTRALIVDAAAAVDVRRPGDAAGGRRSTSPAPWRSVTVHDACPRRWRAHHPRHRGRPSCAATPTGSRRAAPRAGRRARSCWSCSRNSSSTPSMQPTFVRDYPVAVRPLARPHRDDPRLAEAWDLIIGGIEIAPAYSELVDPVEQRRRLVEQSLAAAQGDPEAMELDEDFLRALEYGMPPTGGMGMGVDRLVMLLTGKGIRETILFPLIKPL